MTKKVRAVCGSKRIQSLGGGPLETREGALGALAEKGFEFGKSQFDGIEVWTVSGQIEQFGATVGEGLAHAADLVGGKIVANDEVTAAQLRDEDFLHVGQKHGSLHGAIQKQRGGETIMA